MLHARTSVLLSYSRVLCSSVQLRSWSPEEKSLRLSRPLSQVCFFSMFFFYILYFENTFPDVNSRRPCERRKKSIWIPAIKFLEWIWSNWLSVNLTWLSPPYRNISFPDDFMTVGGFLWYQCTRPSVGIIKHLTILTCGSLDGAVESCCPPVCRALGDVFILSALPQTLSCTLFLFNCNSVVPQMPRKRLVDSSTWYVCFTITAGYREGLTFS